MSFWRMETWAPAAHLYVGVVAMTKRSDAQ
jgi:hypothetical protein